MSVKTIIIRAHRRIWAAYARLSWDSVLTEKASILKTFILFFWYTLFLKASCRINDILNQSIGGILLSVGNIIIKNIDCLVSVP